jgi:DNA-binding LacI/PurR family transcriptional regulator
MADIARLAGVSQATVSRALGQGLVRPETRARIHDIARHHGYAKRAAPPLVRKRSRTIVVVVPHAADVHGEVSHALSVELTTEVTNELAQHGYDVLLSRVSRNRHWRSAFLTSGHADGVIVIGQAASGARGPIRASARAAPLVVWGNATPLHEHCSVSTDDVMGACHATAHLFGLGRRRIVFLGDSSLPGIAERFRGYLQAHRQAKLSAAPELGVTTSFDAAAATAALGALLDASIPFDAVFAMSDGLAIAAIELLRERGLRVPEDISVIGYDDTAAATSHRPQLTTVRQDTRRGGRLLTRKLLELLAGQRPASTVLATELVVRESCGATAERPKTPH